ncbi:MAG: hypothetical protein ACOYIO_00560 [Eubacteriales bacterium]
MKKEHTVINGTKGVISLFLAILMLPFTIFVGALVNANRVNSAAAIFDEALCNAANSTLGTYTPFLKKRFGLLALKYDVKGTLSPSDVQECISGTFSDYMEINCGALSNTFLDAEYQAKGVYPLSDPTVMKGQILQFSKYSVPKQLVEDTIDIDGLIKKFESLIPGYAFFDSIKSIAGTADSCMTYADNISILKDRTDTQDQNYKAYEIAYTEFETAVKEYHEAQRILESAKKHADDVLSDAEATEEEISAAFTAVQTAERVLDDAKKAVSTKKSAYASAIKTLYNSMKKVAEQQATVNSDTTKISQNTADTLVGFVKSSNEQAKINNDKALAENARALKDLQTAYDKNEIDEATFEARKSSIEQDNKRIQDDTLRLKAEGQAVSIGSKQWDASYKKLTNAEKVQNTEHYNPLLAKLDALHTTVNAYDCDTAPTVDKNTYFCDLSEQLLTKTDVEGYEDSIVDTIAKDSIITYFTATINFFKALVSLGFTYNLNLNAKINTSFYHNTYSGLPSQKDRSRYPLVDSETAADRKTSEHYKDILSGYSTALNCPEPSGTTIEDVGTKLGELLELFVSSPLTLTGKLISIVTNLVKMFKIIYKLFDCLVTLVKALINTDIGSFIYQKILVTGYLNYVTPCRTTFQSGTKLTQTSSADVLPGDSGVADEGLCFRGAEREYLVFGHTDETQNQRSAFLIIYALRIITNIVPVVTNTDVTSFAHELSLLPYIGLFVAVAYEVCVCFAEAFIDTLLMVWGQEIPLVKTIVYLTPSGLSYLLKDAKGIVPNDILAEYQKGQKKTAAGSDPPAQETTEPSVSLDKDEPKKTDTDKNKNNEEEKPKNSGYLYVSYEDFLFFSMSLVPTDTLLKRFADIVEMEANWDAHRSLGSGGTSVPGSSGGGFRDSDSSIDSGGTSAPGSAGGGFRDSDTEPLGGTALFDLDYAYTYVRASGSFRMSEFIPSPQIPGFTSKKRVIYRGY